MERSEKDIKQYRATADAVRQLSYDADILVEQERYAEATAHYLLITELAYAMSSTMQKASANDLKHEVFPEDMLEYPEDSPLAGDKGNGNYL